MNCDTFPECIVLSARLLREAAQTRNKLDVAEQLEYMATKLYWNHLNLDHVCDSDR